MDIHSHMKLNTETVNKEIFKLNTFTSLILNSSECHYIRDITKKDEITLKQFPNESPQRATGHSSNVGKSRRALIKYQDIMNQTEFEASSVFNKDQQR